MKDPAVLWYFNDWHGGTITLSRFLKGCYMDLLHAQMNSGNLSLDEIKTVLGSDFGSSWPTLQKKFKQDEKGLYYNERLIFEIDRRRKYSSGRRENLKSTKKEESDFHMEIEKEIEFNIEKGIVNKLQEFYFFRIKKKKPILDESKDAFLRKLDKYSNKNPRIAWEILENSISNGWQGIFRLDEAEEKKILGAGNKLEAKTLTWP